MIKIGISIGDINGIGPEVIIKTLSDSRLLKSFTPIIYGSSKVISYHKNIVNNNSFGFTSISSAEKTSANKVNLINCWDENVNIALGKATEDGGKFAHIALERAVRDLKDGVIDALVTAPINKAAMKQSSFSHPGHTEYLEEIFESKSLMMMVSDDLKIALVTNHEPISKVAETITKELILNKLKIFKESLVNDFGIERPIIAVLGLNPHAGDDGAIGEEEESIIRPAIIEAKKGGIVAMGPFSADGFFGSSKFKKFDGILAMYHDQGLIPFKALSFGSGVNFTAGLEGVRTSPDHGTAYEIAGQNIADFSSFRQAIYCAIDIVHNQSSFEDDKSNAMEKVVKKSYAEEDDEKIEDIKES